MELFLPGVVPPESRRSHFQLVLPLKWKDEKYKPICMHFAGTGDHVRNHRKCLSIFIQINLECFRSFFGGDGILWQNHCFVKAVLELFCWRILSMDCENQKIKCKTIHIRIERQILMSKSNR